MNLPYSQIRAQRRRYFKSHSGPGATLPDSYKIKIWKNGFHERDVLRADHGKKGREDCLFFSERILRNRGEKGKDSCSKGYSEFLSGKHFDLASSHLVSFIPQTCIDSICDFVLDTKIENLSASHIFMDTEAPKNKRKDHYLYDLEVLYRKD